MHPNVLQLAERLVLAVETISQDVKNMSAYMYDLSYCVSQFLNSTKEKEDISVVPCDAGQEVSAENGYSWQYEQTNGNSVLLVDDLEHEENFEHSENPADLSSFSGGLQIEGQSENEGDDELPSKCNILDNGIYKVGETPFCYLKKRQENRDFCTTGPPSVMPEATFQGEIYPCTDVVPAANEDSILNNIELVNENGSPHIQHDTTSSSLHTTTSSSQSLRVEITAMNIEKQLLKNSPSESETMVLLSQPIAAASCSTADDTMHQEEMADTYSLMGHVEQEVAGERQKQQSNQSETQPSPSLRSSIEERHFKCCHCGKAFKRKTHLIRHMPKHTGDRPYRCSQCGKSYSQSHNLTEHILKHTGNRPYKCLQCEKSFIRKRCLNNHMYTHTGEKPYKCTECGKSFTTYSSLRIHRRLHTGERPYKCSHCGKSFTQNINCIEHMRIHTGERPFTCAICGERFKSSAHLSYHKRRLHPAAS